MPAIALGLRLGIFKRLEKGRPRLLLTLQQADAGGDHLGDITEASGRDRIRRELRQIGRQAHIVHKLSIGGQRPAVKQTARG